MSSFYWVKDVQEHTRVLKRRIQRFFSHYIRHSFFIVGILSILWLIFRSGTKPSRISYPCQQLAATTSSLWYVTYVLPILAIVALKKRYIPELKGIVIIFAICILSVTSVFLILPSPASSSDVFETLGNGTDLSLPFNYFIASEKSQIFIVNGRSDSSGIQDLIDGMGKNNLFFYNSSTPGKNTGPSGIIGKEDTVLIKVNCQWDQRGGTNTDVVKGIIQAIVNHPDGFTGEIVIVDNGQGRGSFTWANANGEDHSQSIQKVVNSFSGKYKVSTFLWDSIRNSEVGEYDQGNFVSGYIVNHTANPRTGIHVSYPKFNTSYGTNISLKKGIWKNGVYDNTTLKLINVPVLKTHSGAGVTACIKHYVGVLSVPKTDGLAPTAHGWIYTGGLGTEIAESRIPDLNIVDATWVNAIPGGNSGAGPATAYQSATYLNTLLAGTDPVALDYYGAKYLLMPAASNRGYTDLSSINPDSAFTGSFGTWLKLSRNELLLAGHPATVNESQMEFISINIPSIEGITPNSGVSGAMIIITNLSGTNFQPGIPGTAVHLTKTGQSTITATNVQVITSRRINCTLFLPSGAGALGQWNVTVINPDDRFATLMNGFTISAPVVSASQIGVVRNNITWILDASGNGAYGAGDIVYNYGITGDVYVNGDWNGDGITEIGVVRNNNTWLLDASGNGLFGPGDLQYTFGKVGDVYVTGDWNGNVTTKIGVVRFNTTWLLDASGDGKWGPGDYQYTFGRAGDVYVTGDWNSDNKTEIGVVRNNQTWILDASGNGAYGAGDIVYNYGRAGDRFVTGDWAGNGTTRIGVIRSNTNWLLDASGDGKWGPEDYQYTFGKAGDRYVTGKWG